MDNTGVEKLVKDMQNNSVDKLLDDRDFEEYKGQWCFMITTKCKQCGYSKQRYNSEDETKEVIKDVMSGKARITGRDGCTVPIFLITSLIPMPIGNT